MQKRIRRYSIPSFIIALLFVGGVLLFANYDALYDWLLLYNYKPPQPIAQLAANTTMTKEGRTLFYINHPALENRAQFNKVCPADSEKTIVLGCYHPVQKGIYLYEVSDPQLHGVEQVTAAHEMLHAAYDRLSTKDRNYVDGLLENYYLHNLHDPTILAEIAAYKKSEPHDVVNEMHSVFGTEVASLPAPLEQYYKQYFTNRAAIVHFASDYRSAFTTRSAKIKQYDAQLSELQMQITTHETALDSKTADINTAKVQLDAEKSAENFSAYNNGVTAYNAMIGEYDSLLASTKLLISQYNSIVDKRNVIAFQEQQLEQELTSSPLKN